MCICTLSSVQSVNMYCLYVNLFLLSASIPALSIIPVRSERICSIQRALKCARREFKLDLLQRYILSHFTSKFRLCVMTLA